MNKSILNKIIMNQLSASSLLTILLCCSNLYASTPKKPIKHSTTKPVTTNHYTTTSISSNPAAVNVATGAGEIQDYIEK